MSSLRVLVEKGRLVLDEPTTLPEGTVVDLVADDEGDDLTDEERRALHQALSASWQSAEAGILRPAAEILEELPPPAVSLSVRTTPEADAQIRTIDNRVHENRTASPNLFADEIAAAFDLLSHAPHIGRPYRQSRTR